MKKPAFLVKAGAKLAEKKPDILVGSGIVLMIGAAVVGCVQTAKHLSDICDEHSAAIEEAKKLEDEADQKYEIRQANGHFVLNLIGNYALSFGMMAAGALCIGLGHGEMKKRYLAAEALAMTYKKGHDLYRKRIREKFGEAADRYAMYGIEEEETEDENGEKTKLSRASEDQLRFASPWAFLIDEDCLLYKQCGGSPIHIRSELECFQSMYNTMYHNETPIYYNDVVRWICGNGTESCKRNLKDEGQTWGIYINDPESRSEEGFNLNISTFFGKRGDDDPYDQDKLYILVDFVPAGPIHLGKRRVGGKYISQV